MYSQMLLLRSHNSHLAIIVIVVQFHLSYSFEPHYYPIVVTVDHVDSSRSHIIAHQDYCLLRG